MNVRQMAHSVFNGKTLVLFALLTILQITSALGDPPPMNPPTPFSAMPFDNYTSSKDGHPHQSPQKFKKYIKAKYKVIYDADSRVRQTIHGPTGDLFIRGEIVPEKKPAMNLSVEPDRDARARAIAKAFIDDEAALLGITNPDEIRESSISTGKGFGGDYTIITYQRFINDIRFQGAGIQITIGPEENIKNVSASLTPAPPEAYEATKKKTLSEEEIKSIIEADLTEADKRGYDMNTIYKSFKKVVIAKPPYVKWEAHYIYMYEIDAFTGKILSKISPIIKEPKMPKGDNNLQRDTLPISPPVLPQR